MPLGPSSGTNDGAVLARPPVAWYPGHIAAAERRLREQLSAVDVVFEVRDARAPFATAHPKLAEWARGKPVVVVMNRVDMVSNADREKWAKHFAAERNLAKEAMKKRKAGDMTVAEPSRTISATPVTWTCGKDGLGVAVLAKAARKLAKHVNERRERRGLLPRPVRCAVVGFPNTGKSALVNRLVGRRACDSPPRPGVTRQLRWVRVKSGSKKAAAAAASNAAHQLDMLDSPGIMPMRMDNQRAAVLLAAVDDVGEASYTPSAVAAELVETLRALSRDEQYYGGMTEATDALDKLASTYGMASAWQGTGEDVVVWLANETYQGDIESAARRILKDFRRGALGWLALERPEYN